VLVTAGVMSLAACSPEFDWREVRGEDTQVVMMLPGKPATLTRSVNLDGLAVEMTLQGARVGELSYTVGAVKLPDGQAATRERALAAMQSAMVRNIGGSPKAVREVAIALVDASGARVGSVPGVEVEASGRMRDTEVTLLARFASFDGRAWQAVVLGPKPDPEQSAVFMESFRVVKR
jgi:hypothetical protein